MILKCSSSEDEGSERSSWTVSDCHPGRPRNRFQPSRKHKDVLTYLTPDVVQQPREQVFLGWENVWSVSLVHPVSDELLEWCFWLWFIWSGRWSLNIVVVIVRCVAQTVFEWVTARQSGKEVGIVDVHDLVGGLQTRSTTTVQTRKYLDCSTILHQPSTDDILVREVVDPS